MISKDKEKRSKKAFYLNTTRKSKETKEALGTNLKTYLN